MKKTVKRISSLLVAAAMVLGLMPGAIVFARAEGLPEIPLFEYKFFESNSFDCQRSPAYPRVGQEFYVSGFDKIYNSVQGQQSGFGGEGRYLQFAWADGATANDTKLALELYEADGTYVEAMADYGYLYGKFDEGFFYEGHNHYGYIFTSQDFSNGGSFRFPPATHGKITLLSDLIDYEPERTSGMGEKLLEKLDNMTNFSDLDSIIAIFEELTQEEKDEILANEELAEKLAAAIADYDAVKAIMDAVNGTAFLYTAEKESEISALTDAIDALTDAQKEYFETTEENVVLQDYEAGAQVYSDISLCLEESALTRSDLDALDTLSDGARQMVEQTLVTQSEAAEEILQAFHDAKSVESAISKIDTVFGSKAILNAAIDAKQAYLDADEMTKSMLLDEKLEVLQEKLVSLVKIDAPAKEEENTTLPRTGGEITIEVAGKNLDLLDMKIVVYEGETKLDLSADMLAGDGVMRGTISVPSNEADTDKRYTIKVVVTGPSGIESELAEPTYIATVKKVNSGSSTSTNNDPSPAPEPSKQISGEIIVNGETVQAGVVEQDKNTGNLKLTVDQDTLAKQLKKASGQVTITLPAAETAATSVAQLVVKNVEDMAVCDITLTVAVGGVQYDLPTAAVNTAALMQQFSTNDSTKVPVSIAVTTNLDNALIAKVTDAVAASGGTVIGEPMQFEVTASHEGKTVPVTEFGAYVSRTVEITSQQAECVSTAVVVETDGTIRQVPTNIYQENGKWFAQMNSLTNSTYVLIAKSVSFTDAAGTWFETVANEMGSRQIITGEDGNIFDGTHDITRAEFAAIVVRAMGLPFDGNGTVFQDVSETAWYCGAVGKAAQYGILSGNGDGTFSPNQFISRQEAMVVMQRVAKIAGCAGQMGSVSAFYDSADVAPWASEAAAWCVGSGIAVGYEDRLRPNDTITRAETATMVLKLMQAANLMDVRS